MSTMTFTKSGLTFYSDRYVTQINSDTTGNYHSTLLATTIGSYVGSLVLFILLIERLFTKDIYGHVSKFKWEMLALYLFGLIILITLDALLFYFAGQDRVFGIGNQNNISYNYPFINTLCYMILYLALGALYIDDIFKLNKNKIENLKINAYK